jgi:hypothetical protein
MSLAIQRQQESALKDTHDTAPYSVQRITLDAISAQSAQATVQANQSVNRIRQITSQMKMLALNAKIEAAKAGPFGRGFSVVAQEVGIVGDEINGIAQDIQTELTRRLSELADMVTAMDHDTTGERLVDLAFTSVDTIDRNLYERTCDVRWWATDSSFVTALTDPTQTNLNFASQRLGVILDAYNIYLDLWVCDTHGRILANARPQKFNVTGASVRDLPLFQTALTQTSGDEFIAGDAIRAPLLQDKQVTNYACAIRENGDKNGRIIGVMMTCFDWEPQARSVVSSVRMDESMVRNKTRLLLVDRKNRVIASSDGTGFLVETITFPADADPVSGFFRRDGKLVAYHATEGFETYQGLGWKGVVTQDISLS